MKKIGKTLAVSVITIIVLYGIGYHSQRTIPADKQSEHVSEQQKAEHKEGQEGENGFQKIKEKSVFDVNWDTSDGTYFAGNASCIQTEFRKEPILITAFHLFPLKDREKFSADDMKEYVQGGTLYDILDCDINGYLQGRISLEETYKEKELKASIKDTIILENIKKTENDLAAFTLNHAEDVNTFQLSKTVCKEGETVYLLGTPFQAEQAHEDYIYKGTVIEADEKEVVIYMDDTTLLYGCSGGPIVNESGEIVGILISLSEDGKFVYANGAIQIQKDLEQAFKK